MLRKAMKYVKCCSCCIFVVGGGRGQFLRVTAVLVQCVGYESVRVPIRRVLGLGAEGGRERWGIMARNAELNAGARSPSPRAAGRY
ncbi:hypothetical protein BDZ91DRAFT_715727 [Kalaharituber pfeilii]|nr:hypothetical protein BDZ91DRAFT_715727 [Kalaharituber pfeilii]